MPDVRFISGKTRTVYSRLLTRADADCLTVFCIAYRIWLRIFERYQRDNQIFFCALRNVFILGDDIFKKVKINFKVVSALLANEESSFYLADMPKAEKAWSAIYYQLTEEERELLTRFIMRQGINALFERLGARPQAVTTPDEENIEPVS